MQVHRDIMDGRYLMPPFNGEQGIAWVSPGARVDPSVRLEGPLFVDDGCIVKAGARLGPYTVLGRNCHVGEDANVAGAMSGPIRHIEREAQLIDTIVGGPERLAATPSFSAAFLETRRRSRIQPFMNPNIFKATTFGVYRLSSTKRRFIRWPPFVTSEGQAIGVVATCACSSPSLAEAFMAVRASRVQMSSTTDDRHRHDLLTRIATRRSRRRRAITASHNPKQYNGCKMVGRGNVPLSVDAGISRHPST